MITMRNEHVMRLFRNRMLNAELRTKREELTEDWGGGEKKLHGLPHRLLLGS